MRLFVVTLPGQTFYLEPDIAAESLQDAACLEDSPIRFSVRLRDAEQQEFDFAIGEGEYSVPGGAEYDDCLRAIHAAADSAK